MPAQQTKTRHRLTYTLKSKPRQYAYFHIYHGASPPHEQLGSLADIYVQRRRPSSELLDSQSGITANEGEGDDTLAVYAKLEGGWCRWINHDVRLFHPLPRTCGGGPRVLGVTTKHCFSWIPVEKHASHLGTYNSIEAEIKAYLNQSSIPSKPKRTRFRNLGPDSECFRSSTPPKVIPSTTTGFSAQHPPCMAVVPPAHPNVSRTPSAPNVAGPNLTNCLQLW
ncbi:hypothetical protein CC1G_11114 [Coprinopsis cinerea okayama7|uniref:Uncharacterized protein n=1 Tax=Coprinopsis cinerea (strain Okayama-7 / 130 / ATCC MYA-4618 / FGSC 9003) TaxID=240176 RepID=A8P7R0_COPC7|nr:hypothetical protein CC1G_11114 [Coprinopsis cinerea okayama7\|eukprot:XP_001839414.2 hypothetical protein CC1G_11114 [Coprinopsis cinerea okayama7\